MKSQSQATSPIARTLATLALAVAPALHAAPAPEAPGPVSEPPAKLFTGGRCFAESEAWKAAYARRNSEDGPAKLLEFLSHFPQSTYCDDALYWLGYSYSRQKLYPEAMAAWKKLWTVYPQSTYADNAVWSWASQAYSNRDYAAAIEAYRAFANTFPGNPLADDALYNVTRYARYLKDKEQRNAVAQAAYKELAAKYPSSDLFGSALYQVIRDLYSNKEYEACVGLAQTFQELQPCHDYADEMQYQIVMCYYGAKLYPQALEGIERLRALYPGSSYIDYVKRYEETMRMSTSRAAASFDPEAELEMRDARRGKRSRRRMWRRLYTPKPAETPWMPEEDEITGRDLMDAATSALNARQWERALLFYQLVLDHFRGDAYWDDALYNMATVYDRAGDKARAAAIYERVYTEMIGSDWQDDALYYLAQLYEKAGVQLKAIQVYHEIVEEIPFSRWAETALTKLKKYYFDTRNVPGLLGVYNMIVTRFPGHDMWAEAAFQTGCIQMMYREYPEAIEAFKLVLQKCPTCDYAAQAQFLMAECYRRRGLSGYAKERYEDLLERWPGCGLVDDVQARLVRIAEAEAAQNGNAEPGEAGDGEAKESETKQQPGEGANAGGAGKAGGKAPTPAPKKADAVPQRQPKKRAALAAKPGEKVTEEPAAPDPEAKLTADATNGKQELKSGPTEWKPVKKDLLEAFPDGLKGLADATAPNSRNPLHVVFTAHRSAPVALNITWVSVGSVGSSTFAVNIFLNGKVVGTFWPRAREPMIVEIPKWMIRLGKNHLILYAPMDSGQWDYFALVGDALAVRKPAADTAENKPEPEKKEAAGQEQQPQRPRTEEELLKAWWEAVTDPFSEFWEGRRIVIGKKDRRYTEFSRSSPGNFTEWWVDLDNSTYGSTPNTAYTEMIESVKKDPAQAADWLARARQSFRAGKYTEAAPIYTGLAAIRTLPPEIQKTGREMARVAQEFVKRPNYEAITTEHFHLLAPLETMVLLRQFDIPQLWEAAYTLLAKWVGDVPYSGDRIVVAYDPDFTSYSGGNPIRIGTRYAQDPPSWDPMFSTLAQGFFFTPAVYTALGRSYYLAYALGTFASWRMPEVLLADFVPAAHKSTVASQRSKYLTACDAYIGQGALEGGANFKRFTTNVAAGMLLKLAAMTGKDKPAQGDAWPVWEEFCQSAQKGAAPLTALRKPEEQWSVFAHFANAVFGEGAAQVLDLCGVPQTEEGRAAVAKALAEAEAPAEKKAETKEAA